VRDRLAWLAVLVVAVSAAVGVSLAFSPPVVPLPPPLTLSGPPPVEASPSAGFEVVPSPIVDLTEQDPPDSPEGGSATTIARPTTAPDDSSGDDSPDDAGADTPDTPETPDDSGDDQPDDLGADTTDDAGDDTPDDATDSSPGE
jgi:hypothetical protein